MRLMAIAVASTSCVAALSVGGATTPTDRTFTPLATPAAYESLLAEASPADVTIIKFQSPFCRSCRRPSKLLDDYEEQFGENAKFYSIDLVIDGKAAGRRMKAFFKDRDVKEIPHIEVHRGNVLIDAGPDDGLIDASDRCVVTPLAVSCTDTERPLRRLSLDGAESSQRTSS